MAKLQLAQKVAQRTGMQFIDAQSIVQMTLDSITEALPRQYSSCSPAPAAV